MGKRFKKRFRGFCCWNESSSDAETEETKNSTKEEAVPTKVKKKPRKLSKEERLIQETEKLKEKICTVTESLDALVIKAEMRQRQLLEMISKYLVQDVVFTDHGYGQGSTRMEVKELPMGADEVVNGVYSEESSRVNFVEEHLNADVGYGDQLLPERLQGGLQPYLPKSVLFTDIRDEIEEIKGEGFNTKHEFGHKNEIFPGDFGAQIKASQIIPPLGLFCQRMFYAPVINDTARGVNGTGTKLAAFYTNVARQNVNRSLDMNNLSDLTRPDQLKKICFGLFALPIDVYKKTLLQNSRDIQLALDGDRSDENQCLRGGFGDARTTKNELTTASIEEERGMMPINFNGGLKILEPFHDIRCVHHKETITTLSFPMRISLRDLMRRFEFNESHVRFLCINLLKSLKYIHSLNIIHGQMAPSHVMFTEYGYPCITGFERFKNKSHTPRPKIPVRVEYSSPEEITCQPITAATDVFQTGLIVYFLLYSKSPFKADSYPQTKQNLLNKNFTPGFVSGTLSKDGRYFIRKLLKTEPGLRFKLDRCRKPLEKAIQWFEIYEGEELSKQIYPSPFREFLLDAGLGE